MRPNAEYTAVTAIQGPNGVRAYNPGDDVTADAVQNLGLVVGREVLPANVNVIPRPAGNARRHEWEAYWLGQGLDQAEIDDMTRDQMADRQPVFDVDPTVVEGVQVVDEPLPDAVAEQAAEQANTPEPPTQDAKKPEWVKYAIARGMNEQTAKDSTVAQLQDFDYDNL
ncbi:hypothetical protein [Actinoplanes rectilineatus]|uniref:hypothetical protein n=1 Tax=Actinoplanes rectilineatus TaxID=113571 RepID=UPI0005F2A388|nr:hypothetical protein [Actinoplanes rectilineatus]